MQELFSRKEVCEKLGISERTLRRKIQDLNIECVGETLPNGVESKKIKSKDLAKIAEACRDFVKVDEETKTITVMASLKSELMKVQSEITTKDILLSEKDRQIEILLEDKKTLLDDKRFLQEQLNNLTSSRAEPRGFFQRLFGK